MTPRCLHANLRTELHGGCLKPFGRTRRTAGFEGLGEDPGKQVIATLRNAELELPPGSAVELGGTTRPGTGFTRESPVDGFEQASLHQAVEVESSQDTADADSPGGPVARNLLRLAGDMLVQGTTDGVAKGAERRHLLIEVILSHF